MPDYSDVATMLDEVQQLLGQNRARLENAQAEVATAESELGGIPQRYVDILAYLNEVLAAQPDNEAYRVAAAQIAELTREFQALRARAQAMKDALADL